MFCYNHIINIEILKYLYQGTNKHYYIFSFVKIHIIQLWHITHHLLSLLLLLYYLKYFIHCNLLGSDAFKMVFQMFLFSYCWKASNFYPIYLCAFCSWSNYYYNSIWNYYFLLPNCLFIYILFNPEIHTHLVVFLCFYS